MTCIYVNITSVYINKVDVGQVSDFNILENSSASHCHHIFSVVDKVQTFLYVSKALSLEPSSWNLSEKKASRKHCKMVCSR